MTRLMGVVPALLLASSLALPAHGAILTQWTFTGDVTTPATGSGTLSLIGGTTATFATGIAGSPDRAWNTSNYAPAGTGNKTRGIEISVDTTGYQNIVLAFDQRHSNTANNTVLVQYSSDGSSFTDVQTFTFTPAASGTGDTWYSARTVDLSAVTALNNNPNFKLRILAAFDPDTGDYRASRSTSTYGTAGTWRFDNVTVSADVAATPGVMRITEYIYSGAAGEFIEFTNVGGSPVDMTGWSFDDDSRVPGTVSLDAFGSVQPGESVILTEADAAGFRTAWNLCANVKVIGGLSTNLGRNDEINLYDASSALADRLTYGDQTFSGTIRTQNASGWVSNVGLGTNTIAEWTLSTVADAEGSYAATGGDVGSPGKSNRASVAYDPCPPPSTTAPTLVLDTHTTSDRLDGGALAVASGLAVTGSVGTTDPSDPARTLGLDFIVADSDGVATTTVTASSNNVVVVPNDHITVTGSGTAAVNVKIAAAAVGYSDITVTVSDGTDSASFIIHYAASAPALPGSRFHAGRSDASTALALDDDYMLVADDEDQAIRLYPRQQSGLPVTSFDFTTSLGLASGSEVDLEASTRVGSTLYWLGSHSNNKSGNDRPERERLYATTLSGSGAGATLTFAGHYMYLEDDLIAWDNANGHGLGAGALGLAASAAQSVVPEAVNGFSIEGLAMAPGSTTTAYLAFRAPIVPASARTRALVVPVTNFTALPGASSGSAVFGTPILLDLGGRGIRSLECQEHGCLLIAGAADTAGNFGLFRWSGQTTDAPIPMAPALDATTSPGGGADGSFETIVNLPAGEMSTWAGQGVQVIRDNGDSVYYQDGTIAKDLASNLHKKSRSDWLTLTQPAYIHAIQGSGPAAPDTTTTFQVEAIVVGDYQQDLGSGRIRGFFIQEEDVDADADPTTSEGIFVYCDTCPVPVAVGDKVRVTARASEFQGLTQLSATTAESVSVLASGQPLPTPAVVTWPVPDAFAGKDDYLERFEGMLVTLPGTLTVTENFQLGRFGQVTLAAGDRPVQFTQTHVPSVAGNAAHLDTVARKTILLDDDTNAQNPDPVMYPQGNLSASNTLRSGSTIDNLTGVMHYSWGGNSASPNAWRIRPVAGQNYNFNLAPRPPTPPSVGGTLKVATFNLLNYFSTLDGSGDICGPLANQNCRGADSTEEFTRQRDKIIAAIAAIDADVVGLMEVENTTAASGLQDLVDGLNAVAGAGTYTYVDTGTIGSDAIRVGLLYKPATVETVGVHKILDSTVDADFLDTKNRPVLAQTFREISTGGKFTIAVNHLKSKGSDCNDVSDPDTGDGQGNCNLTRTKAATALKNWLAGDPTGSGDSDYLLIGDFNAYAKEDPITTLETAGFINETTDYSFVFDGQVGSLDHVLTSASLHNRVAGVQKWHINADEPSVLNYNTEFKSVGQVASFYSADAYRSSDHDPVLIGLSLNHYLLTLAQTGTGTGIVGGGGTKTQGETVNLTALANPGSVFVGWNSLPCGSSFAMPGQDLTCTAEFALNTLVNGTTAPGGIGDASPAPVTMMLAGGGSGCGFQSAQFIPASTIPGGLPAGYTFPHGLLDFVAAGCDAASTISLTLTFQAPLPADTVFWKFGPTSGNPTPHWYTMPATFSPDRRSLTFSITDGGLGDDDLTVNGVIVDANGPGVPVTQVMAVPTLDRAGLGLLVLLMLAGAAWSLRRRRF